MRRRQPDRAAVGPGGAPEALAIGPHVPTWAPADTPSREAQPWARMFAARRAWTAARAEWITTHHLSPREAAELVPHRRPYSERTTP